jgi:hypothetical protein
VPICVSERIGARCAFVAAVGLTLIGKTSLSGQAATHRSGERKRSYSQQGERAGLWNCG